MKKVIYIVSLVILCFSCNQKHSVRKFKNITIQEFKIDSTSIRTIVAIDENTVYYAGSLGDFGFTKDGGKTWSTEYITHQDSIIPHFRSLAKNGDAFFALSIANPALLYKISKDKTELVYTENHDKVFYDALQFFDDGKHGIAVGDPTENCASIILTFLIIYIFVLLLVKKGRSSMILLFSAASDSIAFCNAANARQATLVKCLTPPSSKISPDA